MASPVDNDHVDADLEGQYSIGECLSGLFGTGELLLVGDQNIDAHLEVANSVDRCLFSLDGSAELLQQTEQCENTINRPMCLVFDSELNGDGVLFICDSDALPPRSCGTQKG